MELNVRALQAAMMAKGYNVVSLARAAGLAPATVNLYINHGAKPRLDNMGKLARALGVDPFDLVKEDAK